MSKEEMKEVWAKVLEATKVVDEAEKAYEAAVRARSNLLQEISESCGKGPFQVRDLGLVTIVSRGSKKDPSKQPTYFLRGQGQSGVTVVD